MNVNLAQNIVVYGLQTIFSTSCCDLRHALKAELSSVEEEQVALLLWAKLVLCKGWDVRSATWDQSCGNMLYSGLRLRNDSHSTPLDHPIAWRQTTAAWKQNPSHVQRIQRMWEICRGVIGPFSCVAWSWTLRYTQRQTNLPQHCADNAAGLMFDWLPIAFSENTHLLDRVVPCIYIYIPWTHRRIWLNGWISLRLADHKDLSVD